MARLQIMKKDYKIDLTSKGTNKGSFFSLHMYKYLKLKQQVTFGSLLILWENADRIREDGDSSMVW